MKFGFSYPPLEEMAREGSIEKVPIKISQKITEQQLDRSLPLNKATGLEPVTLLQKRLSHRCYALNFVKFLRIAFLVLIDPIQDGLFRGCSRMGGRP